MRYEPSAARGPSSRVLIAIVACLLVAPAANGAPLVMPIAQGLIDTLSAQKAQQELQGNNARAVMNEAPAAGEPADAQAPIAAGEANVAAGDASGSGLAKLLKYLPAYVLLVFFTGLGAAAVCRPVKRVAPDGT